MALVNAFGAISLDTTTAAVRDNVATATARLEAIRDRLPSALNADGGLAVHVQNPQTSVSVSNLPATQPVSGTFWQATQPVSAASLPLPSGAAQEHSTAASPHSARLTDGTTYLGSTAQRLHVSDGGVALAVSGPLTDTQLRATALPVSGPLTDTQLRASALSTADSRLPTTLGQKVMASSLSVTLASDQGAQTVQDGGGSLTVDGSVNVGNFPATQPVSLATNTPDVTDRAAREAGRVRLWDGTDEATLLAARSAPASTDKGLFSIRMPTRRNVYTLSWGRITPTVTTGTKELFHWLHPSTSAPDAYVYYLSVRMLVSTASTAGAGDIIMQGITALGTGTGITPGQLNLSAPTSTVSGVAAPTTTGTATGGLNLRIPATHATTPIGITNFDLIDGPELDSGVVAQGGTNAGFRIAYDVTTGHTGLVVVFVCVIRWTEL
jgi:hypothetical protein